MEDIKREKLPVKMPFVLVGKSRDIPVSQLPDNWKNSDTLELVKKRVAFHFGDRATYVVNQDRLESDHRVYPEFYAAGWFYTAEAPYSELVVIEHGSTMEAARKALLHSMSDVPWDLVCANVSA